MLKSLNNWAAKARPLNSYVRLKVHKTIATNTSHNTAILFLQVVSAEPFRAICYSGLHVQDDLDPLPHLDLVHTSRRLWKKFLPDCTLSSVEMGVLGFSRHSDIPGYLIPSVYFEFLQSGRVAVLNNVLRHNVMDVLSLVGITAAACKIFQEERITPCFNRWWRSSICSLRSVKTNR